jgi:hypothetical protein
MMATMSRHSRRRHCSLAAMTLVVALVLMGAGTAAAATVGWSLRGVAEPTNFSPHDSEACQAEVKCDSYQLLVTNVGDQPSSGAITLTDVLPPGITPVGEHPESGHSSIGLQWACTQSEATNGIWTILCTLPAISPESEELESIPPGEYAPYLNIRVTAPITASGSLHNQASVTGGGTSAVTSTSEDTPISSEPPAFSIRDFAIEPVQAGGAPALGAGGHPWQLTATFQTPSVFAPPHEENTFQPVRNLKRVAVDLPLGFLGNPQTATKCALNLLRHNQCPAGSRVGGFAVLAGGLATGAFQFTNSEGLSAPFGCCSAVYNMVPEHGYPAEFGLEFGNQTVFMYASVVHDARGYHLRVAVPGIPTVLETSYAALTFFGEPGLGEGPAGKAFLSNPTDCSGGPLPARLEVESWELPGEPLAKEATVYPQLLACNLLQFNPALTLAPSGASSGGTSQADVPSAYEVDLTVPQTETFGELPTPPLKDATVTLPQGVSASPSAADGLVGCNAEGPEGINIGSDQIGAAGQDLGDPEATELGAGHAAGNGSQYDDGVYHIVRGHCPLASTLGTVEVFTPLLPNGPEGSAPLQGHIYLATPKCGGAGQAPCTEASATNGELFGGYIEAEGSGVIVKIPGTIAANPQTGQLTGRFAQNPQFPFNELKLYFNGGSRAPIANPQTCGAFATTSKLTSWAGQEASFTSPAFSIDFDGKGGACPASLPLAPGFSAGTTVSTAGAFSPFVLSFSRQDREQDLSGLSVTLPAGLQAKIAAVPLCGEEQANAGSCAAASQIGSASVLAGPGEHPLYVPGGRVYLTGPYKGAPFGMSVVLPAVAGPFNLGNVVVRSAIQVDPHTAVVTVVSDPLPQIKDGVPFRLRTVNVEIDRAGGFTFNPTNCSKQQVSATIIGAQGASAAVSSPFAATGCGALPFKPTFSASTQGKTSKLNGASLTVKVAQKPGEANIRKVQLQLPIALPSRLSTLNGACLAAQFDLNPANCPVKSVIGSATAATPVLNAPLTGPAYIVSHGGAAFPDVEFVLQGQGVTVILDGKTDIKKGITYSRFETVPDAPITAFETSLPEGPHSILAANGVLCAQTLKMPTTIVGQNGAQVTQTTPINVTGCAAQSIKIKKIKVRGSALLITFEANRAGTVIVTGRGLKRTTKKIAAGTHQVLVTLTNAGRRGSRHHRKTTATVTLKGVNGSTARKVRLKL